MLIRAWRGLAVPVLALLGALLPGAPGYAADEADLAVSVIGSSPAIPGESVTWSTTVINQGPASARNVTLTQTVPLAPGESIRSATSALGPCTVTGAGAVSCDLGVLEITGAVRVTVVQALAADRTGPPSTSAIAAALSTDPAPSNNTATTKSPSHPVADLWLTQRATGTDGVLGTAMTATLVVTNNGPSVVPAGTTVTETLPESLAFTASGTSSGCTRAGKKVTCVLARPLRVGPGAAATLVIRGLAPTGPVLAWSASVSAPNPVTDPNPGNNAAAAANPVVGQADVGVSSSGGTEAVDAGTPVSFTYTVTNDGPAAATAVTASEDLPAGVRFDSSASGCTATGQTVSCPTIDTLAPGASRPFVVSVQLDPALSAGTLVRAVRVSSTAVEDPNGSNQTGYAPLPVIRQANLAVSAGRVAATPIVNGLVTYELTVRNLGPATATAVTVTDRLPAEVTLGSATVPGGSCTVAGALHTCTLSGSLAADASAVITVTGTVTGAAAGRPLTDTAYASAVEPDPDPSDNKATTSEIVDGAGPGNDTATRTLGFARPGTGLAWLTWAGAGTVLFGLVMLVLAGRRMVLTRSGR